MLSCGFFTDKIKTKDYYCLSEIYDEEGKRISLKTAETQSFCHARILLKKCDTEVAELLGEMLRMVASSPGEQMNHNVFEYYGFTELLIH